MSFIAESNVARILEISEQEFFFFLNKTVVKILMALVGKVDSMQEQINDISRNKNFKKE